MWRADSFEKTLMLGKIEGGRRGRQRMRWLMASATQRTRIWVNSKSWWWTGRPDVLRFMGSQRVRHNWLTELNWTELYVIWFRHICTLLYLTFSFQIISWDSFLLVPVVSICTINFRSILCVNLFYYGDHLSNFFVVCLVTKSCPTLCDPMGCSPPSSSIHGVSQGRILE